MTRIIGMTIKQAITEIKEMGFDLCVKMNHDNTVKGLTIGNPFKNHFIAKVENDIVVDVREWVWA